MLIFCIWISPLAGCGFWTQASDDLEVACTQDADCGANEVCRDADKRCYPSGDCLFIRSDGVRSLLDDGTPCDDGQGVCDRGLCVDSACGDGLHDVAQEECDDGNTVDTDDCTNLCTIARCGDGIASDSEACDDGDDVQTNACTNACTLPRCGDGIEQAGEACDDGDDVQTNACTNSCTIAMCNDGIRRTDVGPGDVGFEECDDGNADNEDACTEICAPPRCGDALVQSSPAFGEECDDGNDLNDDGCSNNCLTPQCGDGLVQGDEQCDDGDPNDTGPCTSTCQIAACGDGFVRVDVIDPTDPRFEVCDDGNDNNEDGCTIFCRPHECGDGFVQGLEACDDGMDNASDADCTPECRVNVCGDGQQHADEECEDGNTNDFDSCTSACVSNVCGDGFLNPAAEDCDDGATVAFDGCGPTCDVVAWSLPAGPGADDVSGAVLGGPNLVAGIIARGSIPPQPRVLAILAGDTFRFVDVETGNPFADVTSAETVVPPLSFNGRHFAYATAAGDVRGLYIDSLAPSYAPPSSCLYFDTDGLSSSFCVPLETPGTPLTGAAPVVRLLPVFFGIDNTALEVAAIDGAQQFTVVQPPYATATNATTSATPVSQVTDVTGFAAPLPGRTQFVTMGFNSFGYASGNALISIAPGCPDVVRRFSTPDAVRSLAFLGDGNLDLELSGDRVFAWLDNGLVVSASVPDSIPAADAGPAGCRSAGFAVEDGELEPGESAWSEMGGGMSSVVPPLIVPFAGLQVVASPTGRTLERVTDELTEDPTTLFDSGSDNVTFDAAGLALDAEGHVYGLLSDGRVMKVHSVSGQEETIARLTEVRSLRAAIHPETQAPITLAELFGGTADARLAEAPFVASQGVFLVGKNGATVALEGGGNEVPLGGAWSRPSGNNYGSGAATCDSAGSAMASLGVFSVLLFAARRRRTRT